MKKDSKLLKGIFKNTIVGILLYGIMLGIVAGLNAWTKHPVKKKEVTDTSKDSSERKSYDGNLTTKELLLLTLELEESNPHADETYHFIESRMYEKNKFINNDFNCIGLTGVRSRYALLSTEDVAKLLKDYNKIPDNDIYTMWIYDHTDEKYLV